MENTIIPEAAENNGKVNISDEVVAVIASMAANEVEGVAGMASGVAGGFAEKLGMKSPSKGVRCVRTDDNVTVDLTVIVEYGAKIPDISWKLQNKVKNDVEAMTGLSVTAVNIAVDGIEVTEQRSAENREEAQTEAETDSAE